jgi:hypothetical protein
MTGVYFEAGSVAAHHNCCRSWDQLRPRVLHFCFRHSKRLFEQVGRAGEAVFLGNRLLDRARIIAINRVCTHFIEQFRQLQGRSEEGSRLYKYKLQKTKELVFCPTTKR